MKFEEKRRKVMVVEPFCPYKATVIKPLIKHNAKNIMHPERMIQIEDKKSATSRKNFVRNIFGSDEKIRCPSGNFGDRFVNFTPGEEAFQAWLDGYFNTKY